MPPDLALCLTRSSSNYPSLEHIFMAQKVLLYILRKWQDGDHNRRKSAEVAGFTPPERCDQIWLNVPRDSLPEYRMVILLEDSHQVLQCLVPD